MASNNYWVWIVLLCTPASSFLNCANCANQRNRVVSYESTKSGIHSSVQGLRSVKIVLPADSIAKKKRRRRRRYVHDDSRTLTASKPSEEKSALASSSQEKTSAVKQMASRFDTLPPLPRMTAVGAGVAVGVFGGAKLISSLGRKSPKKKNIALSYDKEMERFNDMLSGAQSSRVEKKSSTIKQETTSQSIPAPSPIPTPVSPSPAPPKKGRMGMFKRKASRPGDIEDFLSIEGPMQSFNIQLLSHLAAFAGERFTEYALNDPVDLEQMVSDEHYRKEDVAEAIANCVNAMLIPLVDDALETVNSKPKSNSGADEDDEETLASLEHLKQFMIYAGGLFEKLAAGSAIKPVKYSGKAPKKQLEGLFTKCFLKFDGDSIDNLQRVLGIKDGVAERISTKVITDQMTQAIKEAGEEEGGVEALQELLGSDPSAMAAAADPAAAQENLKEMIEVLKVALAGSDADRTAARKELEETFGVMGMDIKTMISVMEQQNDPQSKELTGLFKKLLDPKYKPPA